MAACAMSLSIPKIVGQTPRVCAGPLDPLVANEFKPTTASAADQGVHPTLNANRAIPGKLSLLLIQALAPIPMPVPNRADESGVIPQSARRYLPLALVSFFSVYLELIVTRWLASEVRIFAYFKNFPLLAAFLGFGIGCLIAKRRKGYFKYAPCLLLILSAVICFAYRSGYTHITFVDPYENYLTGIFSFNVFQMFTPLACWASSS